MAVHREFSIQGHPKSICRSGGTASPPDLLDSNPSTRNLLAVKPPAFYQLPDRLVDTDKSTIRVTILSRTASGATSWVMCAEQHSTAENNLKQQASRYVHASRRYLWRIFRG